MTPGTVPCVRVTPCDDGVRCVLTLTCSGITGTTNSGPTAPGDVPIAARLLGFAAASRQCTLKAVRVDVGAMHLPQLFANNLTDLIAEEIRIGFVHGRSEPAHLLNLLAPRA